MKNLNAPGSAIKPDVRYLITGTKILDDGTLLYVGDVMGKNVMATLAQHFTDHPDCGPIQVSEVFGTFVPRLVVDQVS